MVLDLRAAEASACSRLDVIEELEEGQPVFYFEFTEEVDYLGCELEYEPWLRHGLHFVFFYEFLKREAFPVFNLLNAMRVAFPE